MTKDEHLAWCKERALEFADVGDGPRCTSSMLSDIMKHEETSRSFEVGVRAAVAELGYPDSLASATPAQLRHWVEGFR